MKGKSRDGEGGEKEIEISRENMQGGVLGEMWCILCTHTIIS